MLERQHNGVITLEAYSEMIERCQSELPDEACGILASSGRTISDTGIPIIDTVYPIRNAHDNPHTSFAFDPVQWTAAYFVMQKNRQTLAGLYHSHPNSEAVPSERDRDGFLPASELTYWIVSLKNRQSPHVQPYIRKNGAFAPIPSVLA